MIFTFHLIESVIRSHFSAFLPPTSTTGRTSEGCKLSWLVCTQSINPFELDIGLAVAVVIKMTGGGAYCTVEHSIELLLPHLN